MSVRFGFSMKPRIVFVSSQAVHLVRATIGRAASFQRIASLLVTCDGTTLWCADEMHSFRSIDTKSQRVSTPAPKLRRGRSMVWDRDDGLIYSFDSRREQHLEVVTPFRSASISGHIISLLESTRQLVISHFNDPTIQLYSLPAYYFEPLPKCCDREL